MMNQLFLVAAFDNSFTNGLMLSVGLIALLIAAKNYAQQRMGKMWTTLGVGVVLMFVIRQFPWVSETLQPIVKSFFSWVASWFGGV